MSLRDLLRRARLGLGLVLIAGLFASAAALLIFFRTLQVELPEESVSFRNTTQALPQATIIYSADGEELARLFREHRRWVDHASISTHVLDALVAVEDRRFRQHRGVDLRRLAAATWHSLRGRRQGGSTLTMQLARNLFPEIAEAPTWRRKIQEIATALHMERRYRKEEILELYLNTVAFGTRAYGIEAAAHTYFSTSAEALDPTQAATLVALLKGPSRYSPVRHPERALERRNLVLGLMAEHEVLSPALRDELRERPLELALQRPTRTSGLAPHFVEHVRAEVMQWSTRQGLDPYTDGLRIHTTLDARLQRAAERAVSSQADTLQNVVAAEWSRPRSPVRSEEAADYTRWLSTSGAKGFEHFWETHPRLEAQRLRQTASYREALQEMPSEEALQHVRDDQALLDSVRTAGARLEAGLVALDPESGALRAWVGGRDFSADEYDKVTLARRQPGSTFKPFAYAAALEHGLSPYDLVRDSIVTYPTGDRNRPWRPRNAHHGVSNELVTLREGLAFSLNTVAARLGAETGPEHVAHIARQAGIESPLRRVPSLSLGTSEVSLLELTGAYATLAADGRRHRPQVLSRIENAAGEVLADFTPEAEQALSPHIAHLTVDMLRDVVRYGTGARLTSDYGLEADLAGKTGTSQHGADGWFMLMHPELVTGVWMGFNDPRLQFRSRYWGQGANNALPLAAAFFREALEERPAWRRARFTPPPGHRVPPPRFLAERDPLDDKPQVRPAFGPASPQDTTALERLAHLPMPDELRERILGARTHPDEDEPERLYDPEAILRQGLDEGFPLPSAGDPPSPRGRASHDAERLLRSQLPTGDS